MSSAHPTFLQHVCDVWIVTRKNVYLPTALCPLGLLAEKAKPKGSMHALVDLLGHFNTTRLCRYNFNMEKGPVSIEWFSGAETNLAYNCLDRHVEAGKGDKVAMFWEGNDLDTDSKITYAELLQMVCRIANYLKSIGVKKGDDVTIYMPMVVELPAAMVRMCMHAAALDICFDFCSSVSLYCLDVF